MGWELQQHMLPLIAPSIQAAATRDGKVDITLLATWYADTHWDEDTGDEGYDALAALAEGSPVRDLVDALVVKATEYATTTNGGHAVYLDGWTSIPWCDDETYNTYYGG